MQQSLTTNYLRIDVKTKGWNFDDEQDIRLVLKYKPHSHFLVITQLTIVIYRE